MRGRFSILIALLMIVSMVLSACGGAAPAAQPPAAEAPAVEEATEAPAAEAPAAEAPAAEAPAADANALPRNETLYFNGQQWGSVVGWNPYSSSNNNAMAICPAVTTPASSCSRRPICTTCSTASSIRCWPTATTTWNDARTEITFKLKPAAKWSDGTPVTAEDVAYTWATHVKYNTPTGAGNVDYHRQPSKRSIRRRLSSRPSWTQKGKAVNPLLVAAYVSTNYVIQKAWTETLEERAGWRRHRVAGRHRLRMSSTPARTTSSSPTTPRSSYVRDDNYWGQDASMWGKLPAPKYLAHTIFKDNAAGTTALQAGEVDVSQQFNSNVQDLWEKQNLPISTYLPDPPYGIGASLPTAFYNLQSPGLDQVCIRKAIAIAVDYPTIIANAMTNQSATFDQVPRSLMNPTAGEQALFDHAAVADLQWVGNDIEGAKALLDECWRRGQRRRRLARVQRREAQLRRHLPQRLVRLAGCDRSGRCRRQADRHRHHDQLPGVVGLSDRRHQVRCAAARDWL
jgi:peptide/nickel transport system substrate-binding protein